MDCAIVTGGSRGIGKAIALTLAKGGYNILFGCNRESDEAKLTAEEIKSLGVICEYFCGDISEENTAKSAVGKAKELFGGVDILVNNAGVTKDGLLLRMKTEDFTSVLDVNLVGAFNMAREASKLMVKARKGVIINITSVVGEIGNGGQCNYSASKAGLIGFTKSLARELSSRNVRVNAVAPGFIDTDMTAVLKEDSKESILKEIPLGRFGKPQDVADLVEFLVSDKASYITGQVINVCGGMVM